MAVKRKRRPGKPAISACRTWGGVQWVPVTDPVYQRGLRFSGRAGPRAEAAKAKRLDEIAVKVMRDLVAQKPNWKIEAVADAAKKSLSEMGIERAASTIRKAWQRSKRG